MSGVLLPHSVRLMGCSRLAPSSVDYSRLAPFSVDYFRLAPVSVDYSRLALVSVDFSRLAPFSVDSSLPKDHLLETICWSLNQIVHCL